MDTKRQGEMVKNKYKNPLKLILMDLFLNGQVKLVQRAAWPLSYVAIAHPKLIKPYLGKLIIKLRQTDNHPSVPRNILRILEEIEIPEFVEKPRERDDFSRDRGPRGRDETGREPWKREARNDR